MHRTISNRAFSLLFLITAVEGILATFFLVKEPSEAGSTFAFGLSYQRLFIVATVLLLALIFFAFAIAHFYRFISWNEFLNQKTKLNRFIIISSYILEIVVLYILFLVPDYHFPTLSAYLIRLKPVLIWIALILAQTFIFLTYIGELSLENLKNWRDYKPAIIFFGFIVMVWMLASITGIGITPEAFYWNMAGVPILVWQVWTAIGITLISLFVHNRWAHKDFTQSASLMIFIGIWIITAIIWIRTPLATTFNAPGPYLPAKDIYPFVDAALFDLGAQSALYGRGLFFGLFFDRGLLMGFLALLHMIFGQNYLLVVGAQSAVFAIFPATLYLLGEKLHSKSAGFMVATLGILKVANAIRGGKLISTSHPKLTMTEFPTGIVLVLFSLFLVLWLKQSNSKVHYVAGAGATIGIGILLRTHVFFLVPVVLMLGFLVWKQNWAHAIRDVLVLVFAFFITISPWMWRNQHVAGQPLFFLQRFDSVIEERYQPQSTLDQNRLLSTSSPRLQRAYATIPRPDNNILNQYQFIPRHFVHNLITSVLILPPSPVLDDLRHVVEEYPYWDRISNPWQGQISGSMGIFIAMNLLLLAIGFGATWKRAKFVALVPLSVFLFYNLANAFARTSGGRYIVPVDWVVYFYYSIGLVEVVRICITVLGYKVSNFFDVLPVREHDVSSGKLDLRKTGFIILPFFLMVAALPVIELGSPGEKPPGTTESLMQQLDEISFFEKSGLSRLEVEEFLSYPEALLISGHGFYPRYYSHMQGEPILPGQDTPYTAREYPRLVFTLLLPTSDKPILLPTDESKLYFPDAAEVIVGGCQVGNSTILTSYLNYINAAFIVILDEHEVIYVRVPEAPLECPIREPVCDNNRNCK